MRVCPAGDGKGACACAYGQVPNIRLRPSLQEVHRGDTRLKPKVAPQRGRDVDHQQQ